MTVKPLIITIVLLGSLMGPLVFALSPLKTTCIQIDGQPFQVEIPETPAQYQRGLQFREHLPKDQGMIFRFNGPKTLAFWMKDCKIPLDLLFFNQGTLVNYVDAAPPCRVPADQCPVYSSNGLADTVVELSAGTRQEHRFKTHKTKITLCPNPVLDHRE